MKKALIIILCLIVALIVTNPSAKNFKEYLGYNTYKGLRKDKNFLLFSIYKQDIIEEGEVVGHKKYIGFALNFFEEPTKKITTDNTENAKDEMIHVDTSAAILDSISTTEENFKKDTSNPFHKWANKKNRKTNPFAQIPDSVLK